jgi:outer membrane protein assembly factor BamD
MKNKMMRYIMVASTAWLTACATAPTGDLTGTVGSLYNDGMDALQAGQYSTAVHNFEELQRQFPYSGWASRSEVMAAYAYVQDEKYDEALVALDRFTRTHPGNPLLPYAFYLKGLVYFNQMSDVNRDQSATQEALAAFNEVVNRFPESDYARSAKFKITLCTDHLAGKDMVVGRFYQNEGQFLPAINRFKYVVENYQTSSQTPEALYRLTESYLALGVTDEATRAAAILGHNFPGSSWYSKAYELLTAQNLAPAGQEKSWASQIGKGLKKLF